MEKNAFIGRIVNFLSPSKLEYYPLGMIITDDKGYIVDYGNRCELEKKYRDNIEITDFGENIIMPGFIDTHIHFTHFGCDIEEESLEKWLNVMYTQEMKFSKVSDADIIAKEFLSFLFANGITTAAVYGSYFKEATAKLFERAQEKGMKIVAGMTMVDSDEKLQKEFKKNKKDTLEEAKDLITKYHKPKSGLYYALTPRSAWTCSPAFLKELSKLRREYGCLVQSHLGECKWSMEKAKSKWNAASEISHFLSGGVLNGNTIIAHGVYLSDAEIAILKQRKVGISHTPSTDNVTLKSENRYFRLNDLLQHSIPIGLGVDEPWYLPVFDVMNKAREIQKKREEKVSANTLFFLYTLGAAQVLQLSNLCGNFEKNKHADFVVLNTKIILARKKIAETQKELDNNLLDDINNLLEIILETGDEHIIEKVYIRGKQIHSKPSISSLNAERFTYDIIELCRAFKGVMFEQYDEIRDNFSKQKIENYFKAFLDYLFSIGYENANSETASTIFYKIFWVAAVFYSEELPPGERFINIFKIPPFRYAHNWAKVRQVDKLHYDFFSLIYNNWEAEHKCFPMFNLFLSPPSHESGLEEQFIWLPKPVAFVRDKWTDLVNCKLPNETCAYININNLIPVEELKQCRREIIFILNSNKPNYSTEIEQKVDTLIEKYSRSAEPRLKVIINNLAVILSKPNLAEDINPLQLFRTITLLMLHDDEWQYYYYFPARVIPWNAVGSFVLASVEKLPDEFVKIWSHETDNLFAPLTIIDQGHKIRKYSLHSAVAAIMARNMSHNIGSHILYHLAGKDKYYSYLQSRVDFIAEVLMTEPLWTMTMNLRKDVFQPLLGIIESVNAKLVRQFATAQYKHWGNIVRSEFLNPAGIVRAKYCVDKIRFVVNLPRKKLIYKTNGADTYNMFSEEGISMTSSGTFEWDVLVAVPHGFIGAQAFYSIIENIVRNTAKYRTRKDKDLEIRIEIKPPKNGFSKQFFEVVISDNSIIPSRNRTKVKEEILGRKNMSGALKANPISQKGVLITKWLGTKEMRACAAWLRMREPEAIVDNDISPPLLYVNEDLLMHRGKLVYTLYLLKPQHALIVSKDKAYNESVLNNNGIELSKSHNQLENKIKGKKLFPTFVVFDETENQGKETRKWLEKNCINIPYRIFVVTKDKTGFDRFAVPLSSADFSDIKRDLLGNPQNPQILQNLILYLYKKWLLWHTNSLPDIVTGRTFYKWNNSTQEYERTDLPLGWNDTSYERFIRSLRNAAVFDFHAKHYDATNKRLLYYEPYRSVIGTAAMRMKFLESSEVAPQFLLCQLAEVAITKILILDERLYGERNSIIKFGEETGKRITFAKIWERMGVKIVNIQRRGQKIHIRRTEKGRERLSEIGRFVNNLGSNEYAFALVHQGLIDDEIGLANFKEKLQTKLSGKIRHIIFHSGKGKSNDVPRDIKFIEFSNLRRVLVDTPDKHLLIELLFNLTGKGENEL